MTWRGSPWRPRSRAFATVELSLAWISITYGLNLIFSAQYRTLVTPLTLAAIREFAPLPAWGWALVAGGSLLALGVGTSWPYVAVAGHAAQAFVITALGAAVFQVDNLNQVFLVIGVVLHPVMAMTLGRDASAAKEVSETTTE